MMNFTAHTRRVRLAFDELEKYMLEMIASCRNSTKLSDRHDLLSRLTEANEGDDKVWLTNDELLSNVFIFLVAGHETTSSILCFAMALLALHQDEQNKLYEHINQVLPDGRTPTYGDMPSLKLRMFPPVTVVPKLVAEDTFIKATNNKGEQRLVVAPAGTIVNLHISGLHYNPHYWESPDTFKPSRFLGDWPSQAFLPFSGGYRSYLGRKFFETEAVAALTLFVSRYTIELKEEPQFAGETLEDKKARILKPWQDITLKMRIPLVFKSRH